jgi:hypothetical protein
MPQSNLNYTSTNADGFGKPTGVGAQKDLFQSAVHGTKYNQAFSSALFNGANPSAVTLSAGLATTYVGLCLSNPAGSGFDLALRKVAGAIIIAPATFLALGLMVGTGAVTHTTPLLSRGGRIGFPAGVGLLDSAATIPTPALRQIMAGNLATGGNVTFAQDVEGGIIVPPGTFVAIWSNVLGPTSGFQGSMEWEEIPVVS